MNLILKIIKKIYLRQQFEPGIAGIWINPFYFARKALLMEMMRFAPKIKGRILDVGCGSMPYKELFSAASEYVGLEIDTEANRIANRADFFYNGSTFPFEEASYDGIVCNQVLEHVFNPDRFLLEIHRVLKLDGYMLMTVPFVWDEHEQPWDYGRYSSFGLRSLLKKNGFTVIEQRKTNADVRVLFQLINAYIYKVTLTQSAKFNLLVCVFIMAPFNLLGIVLNKILPANTDLYLDQVVLAKKVAV